MRRFRGAAVLTSMLLAGTALAAGAAVDADAVRADDRLVWPVPGALTRDFDAPDPDWLPGHRGVDLTAAPGQTVVSPRAGVVAWVGTVAATPVVVVDHGIARATYQPVVTQLRPGTPVAAGQVIGTVAAGGHCADRCLHWGLVADERYLDPRLLLGRPRVVLVPVPQ